jgi:hypothetical protein
VAGRLESIFEVGCAYGFWLEQAAAHGMRCAGVDICPEAAQHAAAVLGQNATSEDFLLKDIQPGEYQAYCMWDTISTWRTRNCSSSASFSCYRRAAGSLPPRATSARRKLSGAGRPGA